MSGGSSGKKRSGFQITSVTSDFNLSPMGQSTPGAVLSVIQSSMSPPTQGSSSQPTTPSLKRKFVSQDAPGHGVGSISRFRVVRLVVGGAGSGGQAEPYRRGRWTCMDFVEHQEGVGFRRVMDSMRHAHSLESLEMIGRDKERGGVCSQPFRVVGGAGLVLRSGPSSPTYQDPINIRLLDHSEPKATQHLDSTPLLQSPHPRNAPPPLRLDMDAAGRSVLRLSHSQPSSPSTGSYRPTLTPIQTPGAFSLDQNIFNLPGDTSSTNSLVAIDNKIEQAMDLVKSHLMLAVREEVELLREQIRELQEKNTQLERENRILRTITHTH